MPYARLAMLAVLLASCSPLPHDEAGSAGGGGAAPLGQSARRSVFCLSDEIQAAVTSSGGFSARRSVYEDAVLKQPGRLHTRMFPHLIEGAVSPPMIPEADEIARLMATELAQVVRGEVAPRPALDSIARRLERLLAGKAKLRHPPR